MTLRIAVAGAGLIGRRHADALAVARGVALCAVAALAVAQERVKPKTPADFKATLAAASKAWDNQKYGGCLEHLRTLTALVSVKRTEAELA